jgi:hypothetical protein
VEQLVIGEFGQPLRNRHFAGRGLAVDKDESQRTLSEFWNASNISALI